MFKTLKRDNYINKLNIDDNSSTILVVYILLCTNSFFVFNVMFKDLLRIEINGKFASRSND